MEVEQSIEIHRALPNVYDYVSNPENFAQWWGAIEKGSVKIKFANQTPIRVGTTFNMIVSVVGKKIETPYKIVELIPNSTLATVQN